MIWLFWLFLAGEAAVAVNGVQTTTTAITSSTTASAAVTTHTIAVAATGFNFSPNNITANVGDIIEWNFYPGGHSVVRSAFRFPCIPYEVAGVNRVGFFSGYESPAVYTNDGPKFRVRVNDTEPIFYYCSAATSCIEHHMIGVINENATWSLAIQEEFLANTTIQLAPGDPLPSEGAVSTSSSTASASASGYAEETYHHHLGGGAIAGIVIGSVAALALAGLLLFLRWKHRRVNKFNGGGNSGDGGPPHSSVGSPVSAVFGHHPGYHSGGHGPPPPDMVDVNAYYAGYVSAQSPQPPQLPQPHSQPLLPLQSQMTQGRAYSPGDAFYPGMQPPASGVFQHTSSPRSDKSGFATPPPPCLVELPTGVERPPNRPVEAPAAPVMIDNESPVIGHRAGM